MGTEGELQAPLGCIPFTLSVSLLPVSCNTEKCHKGAELLEGTFVAGSSRKGYLRCAIWGGFGGLKEYIAGLSGESCENLPK